MSNPYENLIIISKFIRFLWLSSSRINTLHDFSTCRSLHFDLANYLAPIHCHKDGIFLRFQQSFLNSSSTLKTYNLPMWQSTKLLSNVHDLSPSSLMLELVKAFVQIMLQGYSTIKAHEAPKGSRNDVETQACGVKFKAGKLTWCWWDWWFLVCATGSIPLNLVGLLWPI